jgi:hypothetical protein
MYQKKENPKKPKHSAAKILKITIAKIIWFIDPNATAVIFSALPNAETNNQT